MYEYFGAGIAGISGFFPFCACYNVGIIKINFCILIAKNFHYNGVICTYKYITNEYWSYYLIIDGLVVAYFVSRSLLIISKHHYTY